MTNPGKVINRVLTVVMWGIVAFVALTLLGAMLGVVHLTMPHQPAQHTTPTPTIPIQA